MAVTEQLSADFVACFVFEKRGEKFIILKRFFPTADGVGYWAWDLPGGDMNVVTESSDPLAAVDKIEGVEFAVRYNQIENASQRQREHVAAHYEVEHHTGLQIDLVEPYTKVFNPYRPKADGAGFRCFTRFYTAVCKDEDPKPQIKNEAECKKLVWTTMQDLRIMFQAQTEVEKRKLDMRTYEDRLSKKLMDFFRTEPCPKDASRRAEPYDPGSPKVPKASDLYKPESPEFPEASQKQPR
ncbi:hypothetical protein BDV25DRAFT_140498 [Aspergillus avenaceus]|uniref:Nudix hydrolase domain-containing protein n=1 Tax=Aspergillus avenaceus TaxID=36643 RepID=A0A5N6TU25_ASPAV|nr:hypothetical protein BDV25DRAFT_140498 [Aspergillus avenaceus]